MPSHTRLIATARPILAVRLMLPNVCVSDRRQRDTDSRTGPCVEAASCSLDAMVILSIDQSAENMLRATRPSWMRKMTEVEFLGF